MQMAKVCTYAPLEETAVKFNNELCLLHSYQVMLI